MGWLEEALTDWAKSLIIPGIENSITGIFEAANEQVSDISIQVGKTPQAWNGSVFNMIKSLSETVVLPIAGAILALVMTLELIQMITEKNNMADFDTWMIFKWIFRATAAILIVSNTWNIVMGIFEAAQTVVSRASGLIGASAGLNTGISNLHDTLQAMDLGPLLLLWIESLLVLLATKAVSILIFVVIYGRMIRIYLVTSVAPIPMATMLNKQWGQMGQNYLRSLLALAFQGVLIIVCVAIYTVLVAGILSSADLSAALLTCLGYSVLLCVALFETGALAKSIFNAH